jgi:hypothetical protein
MSEEWQVGDIVEFEMVSPEYGNIQDCRWQPRWNVGDETCANPAQYYWVQAQITLVTNTDFDTRIITPGPWFGWHWGWVIQVVEHNSHPGYLRRYKEPTEVEYDSLDRFLLLED